MGEIIYIKASQMVPVIREMINIGAVVRITVTGMSMYPFLRDSKDGVELRQTNIAELMPGDIVLVEREKEEYILHRIIKKRKDCFYMMGDGQKMMEGPIYYKDIIGKVTVVWRDNHKISCSDYRWKVLSEIWRRLKPFRYTMINNYRRIVRLLRE